MKSLSLTKGFTTLVDDDVYARFFGEPLFARIEKYGARAAIRTPGRTWTYLHRLIMNAPSKMHVDHINHDPLDNRVSNLRICTPQENAMNRRKSRGTRFTSKYKGVSLEYGRWLVSICYKNKNIIVGRFSTEIEAARAYDLAAVKYHGEFACHNGVDPSIVPSRLDKFIEQRYWKRPTRTQAFYETTDETLPYYDVREIPGLSDLDFKINSSSKCLI